MNKISLPLILFFFFSLASGNYSQDTFSIVAVDPVTGQVGSAGASCVANCLILSDVHPGRGVIHTQAYYLASNQNYARTLMNLGLSPQQIIDSMIVHDAQNNPTIRQYGIVDLIGGGRTAAYTGVNCNDYKNHIIGPTYTIQGNILLGQQILDSMKSRFLNTSGTLAQKLMAALQGAKVVGADTRCIPRNTSSRSSFIRVARPQDTLGVLYLHLAVYDTPVNKDPIDSLQVLFNQWIPTSVEENSSLTPKQIVLYQNYPNPFNPSTTIKFSINNRLNINIKIYNSIGEEIMVILNESKELGTHEVIWNADNMPSGIYYYKLTAMDNKGNLVSVDSKKLALIK
jgi:uncharacterized Ntn-hydrolase superfamily protein